MYLDVARQIENRRNDHELEECILTYLDYIARAFSSCPEKMVGLY